MLPLVSVAGTPEEIGLAYGSGAGDLIRANLDVYRRRFRDQAGLDATAVAAAGEEFRRATLTQHPRVAAMLDGVARGAGVPLAEVYALNARTERLYGHPAPGAEGGPAAGGRGPPPADGA